MVLGKSMKKIFKDDYSKSEEVKKLEYLAGLQYAELCKKRCYQKRVEHQKDFLKELQLLEESQPSAYEAMRFFRNFAVTTIWPPLHRDINLVLQNTKKYSQREDSRLKQLLKYQQF
ncbi:hypothetical protein DMENIID0001_100310 [Sergentomyia squamirostris]